jgi:hypothetical protein
MKTDNRPGMDTFFKLCLRLALRYYYLGFGYYVQKPGIDNEDIGIYTSLLLLLG